MKISITHENNSFNVEGDDVQLADVAPVFQAWLQAQKADDMRLTEATKALKAQNDSLADAVQANTLP